MIRINGGDHTYHENSLHNATKDHQIRKGLCIMHMNVYTNIAK